MLDRLLENKRAVVLFATETPIVTLTANEWGLMEKVLRLLQPFEEYTKLMSKVNSSLSEVIPAVIVLRKFLSKDDGEKTAGVRTMCDELSASLERRFKETFENKSCKLATVVDPRFKTKFVSDGRAVLLEEVSDGCVTNLSSDEVVEESPKEPSRSSGPHQDLWSCFNEIVSSSNQATVNPDNVTQEIDGFLALPLQPLSVCPYVWWHEKKHVYPNVFKVVLKYLSCPSSSVYSEQVFSEAGIFRRTKEAD
jgi:hypothetical protein